jgi:hypothetical protein
MCNEYSVLKEYFGLNPLLNNSLRNKKNSLGLLYSGLIVFDCCWDGLQDGALSFNV